MSKDGVIFPYINYKGDFSYRFASPCKVNLEVRNKYHGDNVWLMSAYDYDKEGFRDFAIEDMIKGVIQHTLETIGEPCDIKLVNLIHNSIKHKRLEEMH